MSQPYLCNICPWYKYPQRQVFVSWRIQQIRLRISMDLRSSCVWAVLRFGINSAHKFRTTALNYTKINTGAGESKDVVTFSRSTYDKVRSGHTGCERIKAENLPFHQNLMNLQLIFFHNNLQRWCFIMHWLQSTFVEFGQISKLNLWCFGMAGGAVGVQETIAARPILARYFSNLYDKMHTLKPLHTNVSLSLQMNKKSCISVCRKYIIVCRTLPNIFVSFYSFKKWIELVFIPTSRPWCVLPERIRLAETRPQTI